MAIWSDSPRISGPPDTKDIGVILGYVKDLANTVAKMAKDLEFLVNGNLDANNIRANSVETKNLKAGSVTTEKIQAGSVTAEKISVNELSAISANLGHIVAGLIESVQIFGSYIATSTSYPRAEMDSSNNLFGAYADWNNYIQIYTPNSGFSPTITFRTPAGVAYITYDIFGNAISVSSNDANINISTQRRIELFAQGGVYVTDWRDLRNNSTGRSLDDDFARK